MADETTDDEVVEVVIHPSQAQYRQLAEDFEVLRAAGAESNTQAVVEAVRAQAEDARWSELGILRREITDSDAAPERKLELLDRYTLMVLDLINECQPGKPFSEQTLSERLGTRHEAGRASSELRWTDFAREVLRSASPTATAEGGI